MNIRIGMDSRYLFVRLLEPTYDGYNRIVAESFIELDKLAEVLATRITNKEKDMKNQLMTESEYKLALAKVEKPFELQPEANTLEASELELLVQKIVAYEDHYHPILPPEDTVG